MVTKYNLSIGEGFVRASAKNALCIQCIHHSVNVKVEGAQMITTSSAPSPR